MYFHNNQTNGESSASKVEIKPNHYGVELSGLYAALPSHFSKLGDPNSRLASESRQRLGQTFGTAGFSWPQLIGYANQVYDNKGPKLRNCASHTAFLAELERVRPHFTAAHLAANPDS